MSRWNKCLCTTLTTITLWDCYNNNMNEPEREEEYLLVKKSSVLSQV